MGGEQRLDLELGGLNSLLKKCSVRTHVSVDFENWLRRQARFHQDPGSAGLALAGLLDC